MQDLRGRGEIRYAREAARRASRPAAVSIPNDMTMGLGEIVSREARDGCPRLAGTRIDATLVVTEATVLDLLRRLTNVPQKLELRIESGNRVVVRYSGFETGAVVAESVDLRHNHLQLRLDSVMVGWTLGFLLRSPAVKVTGRTVSIEFERLHAFDTYRPAWTHVRWVGLSTATGSLRLQVQVEIAAAGAGGARSV